MANDILNVLKIEVDRRPGANRNTRKRHRTTISDVGLQGSKRTVQNTALPSHSRHEHQRIIARDADSRGASDIFST